MPVCDVTSFEAVQALVEAAVATYGRLDVLVNNAYINRHGTVVDVSIDDWNISRSGMLDATFYGCKAAIPHLIAAGGGSIISLSSVHGYLAARNSAVYEASKASLINLMREVACDFGPQGIRANCICPGLIVTEVTNPRYEADPEWARFAAEIYPVRRYGRPDDIANAALFLASDESTFVTGHALVVDGGMTAQLQDDLAARIAEYVKKSPEVVSGRDARAIVPALSGPHFVQSSYDLRLTTYALRHSFRRPRKPRRRTNIRDR
ncbi:MAG: SDR family oxidoreductase [Thermomicrobiales bacterium]